MSNMVPDEKFLAWKQFSFDGGRTMAEFIAEIKTHLTSVGWQVEAEGVNFLAVKPPVTTQIGNTRGYAVTYFSFTTSANGSGDSIKVESRIVYGESQSARYHFRDHYYYESDGSPSPYIGKLMFGALEKSFNTGAAFPNRRQRTIAFYNAIIASNDPDVLKYNYQLIDPNSGPQDSTYIVATAKDASALPLSMWRNYFDWGSATVHIAKKNIVAGTMNPDSMCKNMSIPLNFLTGFVYYLSIGERYIYLCTKDTQQTYGPLMAMYLSHDAQMSIAPDGIIPIELYCGRVYDASWARIITEQNGSILSGEGYDRLMPSHLIGRAMHSDVNENVTRAFGPVYERSISPFTDGVPFVMEEVMSRTTDLPPSYVGNPTFVLPIGYSFAAGYADAATKIYGSAGFTIPMFINSTRANGQQIYGHYGRFMGDAGSLGGPVPGLRTLVKAASNEGLHLVRQDMYRTKLTAEASIDASVLTVESTARFPAAGTLRVGNEVIIYSSKTPTTFEGCERGRYNFPAAVQSEQTSVYLAMWYVTMNKMALPVGYLRP